MAELQKLWVNYGPTTSKEVYIFWHYPTMNLVLPDSYIHLPQKIMSNLENPETVPLLKIIQINSFSCFLPKKTELSRVDPHVFYQMLLRQFK